MAIFRGTGGSGDSTQDATLNEVTQQAINASNSATAAAGSATTAGSSASAAATSATNSATSETNASNSATAAASSESNALSSKNASATSETNAASSASSASTSASTATTKASEASSSATATAADLVATNQDTIDTAADLVATNADVVLTAADVVSAEADKVQTGLDRAAVAADLVATNQDTIDTAADVTSSGNSATAAANSAAAAATALDNFDDRYLGAKSSAPSVDNDGAALVEGAMYFDSSSNGMKVYDGADWIAASAAGTASMLTYRYIATNAQTTFSGSDANSATLSYTVSNIIVLLNGIALDSSDFTATSGTSVVLGTGATTGDEFVVVAFKSFTVADHYSKTAADARFEPIDSAYTKAESDAAYEPLDSAYTKAEGDARYEPIDSAYTKAEADSLLNAKETVTNVALKAPLASPDFTGGIDVTGTVTADGLTTSGDLVVNTTGNTPVVWANTTGSGKLSSWNKGGAEKAFITNNGGASFGSNVDVTGSVTAAGNVGIGTSSPAEKLEVDGVVQINRTGDHPAIRFSEDGTTRGYIGSGDWAINGMADDDFGLSSSSTGDLSLGTGGTNRLHISTGGNVGIGTTSPVSNLQVSGANNNTEFRVSSGDNASGTIAIGDGGTGNNNVGMWRGAANSLSNGNWLNFGAWGDSGFTWSTANAVFGSKTERMKINSSGLVGIGTSSPAHKLSIFGTGVGNATVQIEGEGGADPYINFLANNAQHWSLGVDDSDSDKFKLSKHSALGTNDYLVVDTSGNVMVGTTAVGGVSSGTKTYITSTGNLYVASSGEEAAYFNRNSNDGSIVEFRKNNASVGSIGNNTDFYIASADGAGLRFTNTQVLPCSESGATQNGSRDLGSTSGRFKDLHLSGSVNAGGTVTATAFSGDGFDLDTGKQTSITGNSWIRIYSYTGEHILQLSSSHNAHPEFYTVVTNLYPGHTTASATSSGGYNYTYSLLNFRRATSGGINYIEVQGHQTQGKLLKIANFNTISGDVDLTGGTQTWT